MAIVPAVAAPEVANPRSGGDADASARLALVAAVTSEAPTGHFVIYAFVTCDPSMEYVQCKIVFLFPKICVNYGLDF